MHDQLNDWLMSRIGSSNATQQIYEPIYRTHRDSAVSAAQNILRRSDGHEVDRRYLKDVFVFVR